MDFEKTFNNVCWDFLSDVLQAKGFGAKLLGWIKELLLSSRSSCLVNGAQGPVCKIGKGLKQECPLSPLLLILVIDAFDGILKLAAMNELIRGLGAKSDSWRITNLHFVDDTLLFCHGSRFEAICLKVLLYRFEIASALGSISSHWSGVHE